MFASGSPVPEMLSFYSAQSVTLRWVGGVSRSSTGWHQSEREWLALPPTFDVDEHRRRENLYALFKLETCCLWSSPVSLKVFFGSKSASKGLSVAVVPKEISQDVTFVLRYTAEERREIYMVGEAWRSP